MKVVNTKTDISYRNIPGLDITKTNQYEKYTSQFVEMTMGCEPIEALNALRGIYAKARKVNDLFAMAASEDLGNSLKQTYGVA